MENNEGNEPTSAAGNSGAGNSGTSAKTVPESDFIALKQSADTRVADAQQKVVDAEAKVAELVTTLDSERVDHKSTEAKAGQVDALAKELSELKMSGILANEEHDKLKGENLKAAKAQLVTVYKLPQEKVDSMTIEQTQMFLSTLPTPSSVPSMAGMGLQSGQGDGDENLRPVDRMRRALDADK